MMELHDLVNSVKQKEDLVRFIHELAQDRRSRPQEWENDSLERYLSALANWLADSDAYYRNQGREIPLAPTWKNVAEMLIAAKIYE